MVLEGSKDYVYTEDSSPVLESKYVVCLFVILFFCLVDGAMTLVLVGRGAWEANPVMRYALSVSDGFFILLKYALTAGGLLYLFVNGRMRIFRGKLRIEEIAIGIVLLYETLVIYEVTIFHFIQRL